MPGLTTAEALPQTPRGLRDFLLLCLLVPLSLPFGTLCHEVIGHGLTGILCGGQVTGFEILGFRIWPHFEYLGWDGGYGFAYVDNIPTERGEQWMHLGGSLSTWLVSVAAVGLLWIRRWGRVSSLLLACLGFWWIDLFTYTLPTWGLRRSIFWGGTHSEPYEAAIALGVPGPLFQMLVVFSCGLLLIANLARFWSLRTRSSDKSAP